LIKKKHAYSFLAASGHIFFAWCNEYSKDCNESAGGLAGADPTFATSVHDMFSGNSAATISVSGTHDTYTQRNLPMRSGRGEKDIFIT
jgi:hypothetical protein